MNNYFTTATLLYLIVFSSGVFSLAFFESPLAAQDVISFEELKSGKVKVIGRTGIPLGAVGIGKATHSYGEPLQQFLSIEREGMVATFEDRINLTEVWWLNSDHRIPLEEVHGKTVLFSEGVSLFLIPLSFDRLKLPKSMYGARSQIVFCVLDSLSEIERKELTAHIYSNQTSNNVRLIPLQDVEKIKVIIHGKTKEPFGTLRKGYLKKISNGVFAAIDEVENSRELAQFDVNDILIEPGTSDRARVESHKLEILGSEKLHFFEAIQWGGLEENPDQSSRTRVVHSELTTKLWIYSNDGYSYSPKK